MLDEAVLERDRDAALSGMGLDSLMTIELRNRLESSFGLRLSPTLLWQHGSVARLGSVLTEMVGALPADR
jgi:phthiocerol/phenolphthiocerol synthesis type-I polyketide synthase C